MKKFYSIAMAAVAMIAGTMTASAERLPLSQWVINPLDGQTVEKIEYVEVSFPETNDMYDSVGYNGIWYLSSTFYTKVFIKKGDEVVATGKSKYLYDDDPDYCKVTFDKTITEAGTYTLVFSKGLITDYANYAYENPEITATYYIGTNGVDEVTAETPAALKGIYTLQGVRIDTDRANLAPGLYIIDGKKVAIK